MQFPKYNHLGYYEILKVLKRFKTEVNDLQHRNNRATIEHYNQEFQQPRGPWEESPRSIMNSIILITKVLWQKPSNSSYMLHFKSTCFQNMTDATLSVSLLFKISPLDNQFPFTEVGITR